MKFSQVNQRCCKLGFYGTKYFYKKVYSATTHFVSVKQHYGRRQDSFLFETFETIYRNVIFSAHTPLIGEESKLLRDTEKAQEVSRGDPNTRLRWSYST